MADIGAEGEVDSRHSSVQTVMNVLHGIDSGELGDVPSKREAELVETIKLLRSLLPEWVHHVPKGLCATMYGTGSYEGDLRVKEKVSELLTKAMNKDR